MRRLFSRERMWRRQRDLQRRYDVVIIGAGIHGLAIAYYLCKRGIRSVAVLERSYLGSGNSGRNTAILRSNYRTPEGIPFYNESMKMWETLAGELEYNLLFSQQGHITVAHTTQRFRDCRYGQMRIRFWGSILGSSIRAKSRRWCQPYTSARTPAIRSLEDCTTRPVATSGTMRWFGLRARRR